MSRPPLRLPLLLVICTGLGLAGGCRRKRVEPPPPPVPEAPVEISAAPAPAPAPGAAMPPMTQEMMLKFEAQFGRPPTNYSELSRLQTPPPAPKPR